CWCPSGPGDPRPLATEPLIQTDAFDLVLLEFFVQGREASLDLLEARREALDLRRDVRRFPLRVRRRTFRVAFPRAGLELLLAGPLGARSRLDELGLGRGELAHRPLERRGGRATARRRLAGAPAERP